MADVVPSGKQAKTIKEIVAGKKVAANFKNTSLNQFIEWVNKQLSMATESDRKIKLLPSNKEMVGFNETQLNQISISLNVEDVSLLDVFKLVEVYESVKFIYHEDDAIIELIQQVDAIRSDREN